MPQTLVSAIDAAALAACADEPIHIPGTIQPRGVLVAVDVIDAAVTFVSANAADVFGVPVADLLAMDASALFGVEQWRDIRDQVMATRERVNVSIARRPSTTIPIGRELFAHRYDDRVIIELIDEADSSARDPDGTCGTTATDLTPDPALEPFAVASSLQRVAATLVQEPTLRELGETIAREVHAFTGYDRVMVYQFDHDDNGEVIAEARRLDLEPFLGLHYPASDIPAQARRLYLTTRVRVLDSASHVQVALLARGAASTRQPLDLSSALLRSMSPIHLQYLTNMQVCATMVVSIIVDGRLWGLVACHHMSAKWPSSAMRTACAVLSEFISVQIAVQQNVAESNARLKAFAGQGALARQLMTGTERDDPGMDELFSAIPSTGAAIIADGHIHVVGTTPPIDRIHALAAWLTTRQRPSRVTAFHSLGLTEPAFGDIADVASGVLVLDIGGVQPSFLLWFRAEEPHTIRWAGRPGKAEWDDRGSARLSPRASFREWSEVQRGHSAPWLPEELIAAETIRGALVEVVFELLATRHRVARLEYVRIRSAVDASRDGIAITDSSGAPVYMNASFSQLTGYTLETLVDLEHLFVVGEPGAARPRTTLMTLPGDAAVVSASGEQIAVSLRMDTVLSDDGANAGSVIIISDQRPSQLLLAEREQIAQRLAQSERLESLGIMAGGIAHDFNNLLTTISGNAVLAHQDAPDNAAVHESLDAIEHAVDHAAGLCRQLLAYAGKGQHEMRPLDIDALIADLVRLLRTSLQPRHSVKCILAGTLPRVTGDETQLRQVLMNLIINGTDAIGAAAGTVTVSTAVVDADEERLAGFLHGDVLPPGRYVEIRVVDSGDGMDAETQRRIFDPFFSTKFAGRGLGLAAALGTISGHQGALRVDSAPGAGTTFTLLLPISGAAPTREIATPPLATHLRGDGRTILLVDDDKSVSRTMRRLLERAAFQVVQADDGQTALSLFEAEPSRFALLLSDVAMRGMDGTSMLKELRRRGHQTPVLLFSGYSASDVNAIVSSDTRARFVQKPFSIDVLEGAMAELLVSTTA